MDFPWRKTSEYTDLSLDETLFLLKTRPEGLTSTETGERLESVGPNEIAEPRQSRLREFLVRYWGPLPWLLEIAAVLSFLLGHRLEAYLILALLSINAVIGLFHARSSRKAIELLRRNMAVKAKILRDGQWVEREARELVPGDIIALALGNIVPADAKILSGELLLDESSLTGESRSADRPAGGMTLAGTFVRQGEARAVVVNTAGRTFFGRTAELVKIAAPRSHQEDVMLAIVRNMMILGLAAALFVSADAWLRHVSVLEILTFAVIFLMGAVPVALPTVLTIVQAVGALELSREGALVTRLDSIEDASAVDVLCLDKTGTMTQNKLAVAGIVPASLSAEEDVLLTAAAASREESRDPIDLAVLDYARRRGIPSEARRLVSFTPFNPSLKRSEAVVEMEGREFRAVKGAPQIVLPMCRMAGAGLEDFVKNEINLASKKGYRAIAVGRSDGGPASLLRLVGLIFLADPPRPDSAKMIEAVKRMGIRPMMLTGDHAAVARQIAREVGIGGTVITRSNLGTWDDGGRVDIPKSVGGIAEIYPEDKFRIVRALQSQGCMVGMTGDGVNDAPALKQAEMGIAVSNAADVAKASASVVLTRPGIGVIVQAIGISRKTYERMLTWVINKVAKVVQMTGVLAAGFVLGCGMVLSLFDMALVIFANDFVTMSLASDEAEASRRPSRWDVRRVTLASAGIGLMLALEGVVAILAGLRAFHLDADRLRTFILLWFIFSSQFRVILVRERGHFWSSRPGKALLFSIFAAVAVFALIGAEGVLVPPLPPSLVLVVLVFSAAGTLALDYPKRSIFRILGL
jgi:H+-transporting ATPase